MDDQRKSKSVNITRDHRSEEVLNCYYKDPLIYNKVKNIDVSVVTGYKYENTLSEPSRYSSYTHFSGQLRREKNKKYHTEYETEDIGKVTYQDQLHKTRSNTKLLEDLNKNYREKFHERVCADKTTYCQPVVNLYNQQFLFRTIEKNARLQRIVKELINARQREKEIENWKNYINNLRKKHKKDPKKQDATPLQNASEEFIRPETIEDHFSTSYMCNHSNHYHNLLQDFYNGSDLVYNRIPYEYLQTPAQKCSPFDTNPLCYPTSSYGRRIVLERERQKRLSEQKSQRHYRTISEKFELFNTSKSRSILKNRGINTNIETSNEAYREGNLEASHFTPRKLLARKKSCYILNRNINTIAKTQTESQKLPSKKCMNDIIVNDNSNKNILYCSKQVGTEDKNNLNILHENINCTDKLAHNSLASIEGKLDSLINSINDIIHEIKTKKYTRQKKNFNQSTKLRKELNFTKSDICGITTKERSVITELVDNSSRSTGDTSYININNKIIADSKLREILRRELNKSNLITLKDSSVGDIYHPCSVQISVTIPTKEIATEITKSFATEYGVGDKKIVVEEVPFGKEEKCMTIAVNTDPLSLFSLLKESTEETIRRILSYVPTIDYYYFLSRLQALQHRGDESHYNCNICGAAFNKPSQLSDHIQKHELGKARDCCVCRHVLELPRRRPSLWKCHYCGQLFTRAYCCELHQQSCARRMGMPRDVKSSLVLLK